MGYFDPIILATLTWIYLGWFVLRLARSQRHWFLWGLSLSSFHIGLVETLVLVLPIIQGLFKDPYRLSPLESFLFNLSGSSNIGVIARIVFGVCLIIFALRLKIGPPPSPESPPDAS